MELELTGSIRFVVFMKGENIVKGIVQNLKKQSPLLLSIVGSLGVIGTAVTAVRATPKALVLIEEAQNDADTNLTVIETVKVTWKCYIPSAAIGLATIGCIFGSTVLSRHQLKSLASAYMLLDQTYREYKRKVNELYGEGADREVKKGLLKDMADDSDVNSHGEVLVFYEENYGKLFERTMLEVVEAEYKLNRQFALNGEASINDFLDLLGLEHVEFGNCIGWLSNSNYDFYGHPWIEFKHDKVTLDDGMECVYINIDSLPSIYY